MGGLEGSVDMTGYDCNDNVYIRNVAESERSDLFRGKYVSTMNLRAIRSIRNACFNHLAA